MEPTQLVIPINNDDLGLLPYYAKLADADIQGLTDPADILGAIATAFERKLRAQAVDLAASAAALEAQLATFTQYQENQS